MTRYLRRMISSYDDNVRGKKTIKEGTCGLYNMGNTCYFNSVLQCLTHTDILKDYSIFHPTPFLKDKKFGEESNFVSTSSCFFAIVKYLWSEDYEIVTPKALKEKIGKQYTQFKGSNQQDAQEFLLILLDALNESLQNNEEEKKLFRQFYTALYKSPLPPRLMKIDDDINEVCDAKKDGIRKDEKDVPDGQKEEVRDDGMSNADDVWKKYIEENNSIITELFSGQQKQEIKCCECGYTSDSYDPFNCLSLTIPSISQQKGFVSFVYIGKKGVPMEFKILLSSHTLMKEVVQLAANEIKEKDRDFSIENKHFGLYIQQKNQKDYKDFIKKMVTSDKLTLCNFVNVLLYDFNDEEYQTLMKMKECSKPKKSSLTTSPILAEGEIETDVIDNTNKKVGLYFGLIFIRRVKSNKAVILHNYPILISLNTLDVDKISAQIKERLKDFGEGEITIITNDGKRCEFCFEKQNCTGCKLYDGLNIEPLIEKNHIIYFGYDFKDGDDNDDILDQTNHCNSHLISNNQRLQTTAVSLFACLTLFTHGDSYDYIDWKCEKCKKEVKATVKLSVYRPPPILIFHLKRFEFTAEYERIKTYERIVFPNHHFDLKEYLGNDSIKNDHLYYNLFAIINHEGSIDKGHYFAQCLVNNEWFEFNDEKVTRMSDVPTGSDNSYILFYKLDDKQEFI